MSFDVNIFNNLFISRSYYKERNSNLHLLISARLRSEKFSQLMKININMIWNKFTDPKKLFLLTNVFSGTFSLVSEFNVMSDTDVTTVVSFDRGRVPSLAGSVGGAWYSIGVVSNSTIEGISERIVACSTTTVSGFIKESVNLASLLNLVS